MKNQGYVYANKALESAVRDLKSSFFDIFYHSQGTLLMLMTQLDELEVDGEALKEEAVDLINSQGTLLSESMALVEDLIRSIKKIDNKTFNIEKMINKHLSSRNELKLFISLLFQSGRSILPLEYRIDHWGLDGGDYKILVVREK